MAGIKVYFFPQYLALKKKKKSVALTVPYYKVPVLDSVVQANNTKGLISKVYTKLLSELLLKFAIPRRQKGETDIDVDLEEIWDQIMRNVQLS